jgi:hypothetical protein
MEPTPAQSAVLRLNGGESTRASAEFHAKRSVISSEFDHRFQGKAITDFTGKRSGISRETDH